MTRRDFTGNHSEYEYIQPVRALELDMIYMLAVRANALVPSSGFGYAS